MFKQRHLRAAAAGTAAVKLKMEALNQDRLTQAQDRQTRVQAQVARQDLAAKEVQVEAQGVEVQAAEAAGAIKNDNARARPLALKPQV
jgi:hypothetical protein